MRRLTTAGVMTLAILGFVGTPVASAQQQVSFSVGGFSPRSETSRTTDDVLVNNLDFLAFRRQRLQRLAYSAASGWSGSATTSTPASASATTSEPCPTVYTDFVNANGTEIEQDLQLRVVPFTATVRLLPLGITTASSPYIGAGVGVFN